MRASACPDGEGPGGGALERYRGEERDAGVGERMGDGLELADRPPELAARPSVVRGRREQPPGGADEPGGAGDVGVGAGARDARERRRARA